MLKFNTSKYSNNILIIAKTLNIKKKYVKKHLRQEFALGHCITLEKDGCQHKAENLYDVGYWLEAGFAIVANTSK